MMQIQENPEKKNQDKKNTGALNTEEILSLLSKTSQDFKKESEITENVSYLFNKKTLKDMALSNSQNLKKTEQPEIVDKEVKKNEIEEEKKEETIEEKKITETEAKKMANELAKEYYNKGYNLGVKKVKEELEKGEQALAVNFKNLADNIFTVTPDFIRQINDQININLKKISRQMLGYEIDTKTEKFFEKVSELTNLIENSLKQVKIFLNKEDFESVSKYLTEQNINIDQKLEIDKDLQRGDLKIKSGSIEVANILSNKTKFVQSTNINEDLEDLKNNIESNTNQNQENNNKTLKNNDVSDTSKK